MMHVLKELEDHSKAIAVVGLGYVGLPLAAQLATQFKVVGFDINAARVEALQRFDDETGEVSAEALRACDLRVTTDASVIAEAAIIIVTVPTPITSRQTAGSHAFGTSQ